MAGRAGGRAAAGVCRATGRPAPVRQTAHPRRLQCGSRRHPNTEAAVAAAQLRTCTPNVSYWPRMPVAVLPPLLGRGGIRRACQLGISYDRPVGHNCSTWCSPAQVERGARHRWLQAAGSSKRRRRRRRRQGFRRLSHALLHVAERSSAPCLEVQAAGFGERLCRHRVRGRESPRGWLAEPAVASAAREGLQGITTMSSLRLCELRAAAAAPHWRRRPGAGMRACCLRRAVATTWTCCWFRHSWLTGGRRPTLVLEQRRA